MGINITHTMNSFQQFENRENLRNAAKNILNKQTASQETVQKSLIKPYLTAIRNYQLSRHLHKLV